MSSLWDFMFCCIVFYYRVIPTGLHHKIRPSFFLTDGEKCMPFLSPKVSTVPKNINKKKPLYNCISGFQYNTIDAILSFDCWFAYIIAMNICNSSYALFGNQIRCFMIKNITFFCHSKNTQHNIINTFRLM